MKILNIVFLLLFLSIIITPLLLTNHKRDQVSEIDNKYLAEFPKVEPWHFRAGFESYFLDRIGFREDAIRIYNTLYVNLFHEFASQYYYGKDGHFFFKMPEEVDKDSVDESYLCDFATFVGQIQNYCLDRNISFIFMINPMKMAVYPKELPDGINYYDKRMKKLDELLMQGQINFISVKDILSWGKDGNLVFNKKYDVLHWNDNGAFSVFNTLIKILKNKHPTILNIDKDMYNIGIVKYNKVLQYSIFINDAAEQYSLKTVNAVKNGIYDNSIWSDPDFTFLPYYAHYTNEHAVESPRLLVFAGSYYMDREKFLTESFSEVMFVRNYWNVFNFDYYINIFKPDIVVFTAAQHALFNYFFPAEKMKNVKYQPSLQHFAELEDTNFANIENKDWDLISAYVDASQDSLVDLGWNITGGGG
jgi:hypothetical protein